MTEAKIKKFGTISKVGDDIQFKDFVVNLGHQFDSNEAGICYLLILELLSQIEDEGKVELLLKLKTEGIF